MVSYVGFRGNESGTVSLRAREEIGNGTDSLTVAVR
jgi:hypothetical protein